MLHYKLHFFSRNATLRQNIMLNKNIKLLLLQILFVVQRPLGVSILTSYGENPHYVKLPIFSEFMKNSDLTKWTQNQR